MVIPERYRRKLPYKVFINGVDVTQGAYICGVRWEARESPVADFELRAVPDKTGHVELLWTPLGGTEE
jgi:hypothetical protein